MKIIGNEYTSNQIVKMIREWTELTQKEFAKDIGRSERGWRMIENGERRCDLSTFLEICNKHNIEIIIRKGKNE